MGRPATAPPIAKHSVNVEQFVAADDFRRKWKGLRDTFRKELRKYPNGFDQDLSQEEFPQWVFFKPLYFLKGQMKAKHRSGSDAHAGNGYHYLMSVHKEEDDDDNSGDQEILGQGHSGDMEAGVCGTLREVGKGLHDQHRELRHPSTLIPAMTT